MTTRGPESPKERKEHVWGRGVRRCKGLRLAWRGADWRTSGGQCPACLLGGGGGGWLLTRALSPSSSIQGSLPQPPPVDVMAAPALPRCLSLLVLLLSLAIPQASTAVNGEDPGICRAGLPLRREAEALLELVLRPLILGRSPISRGRRWGTGPMGPETGYLPSPSTILSTLYPRASPNPRKTMSSCLCPASTSLGVLAGCGTQFCPL